RPGHGDRAGHRVGAQGAQRRRPGRGHAEGPEPAGPGPRAARRLPARPGVRDDRPGGVDGDRPRPGQRRDRAGGRPLPGPRGDRGARRGRAPPHPRRRVPRADRPPGRGAGRRGRRLRHRRDGRDSTMTASVAAGVPTRPGAHAVLLGPEWFARESWAEGSRHLNATTRNAALLVFAAIQPVMFVVLFVCVFGGAIQVPGFASYEQFVLPGIFAQTVLFGSAFTGIGIAEDMSKGFIDRLRSLPMHQSAVLVGRTVSDLVRNVFTFVIMLAVGLLVGFRLEGGIVDAVIATLLLLAFAFAFSWIQALIGLSVRSVEAANSAGFIWMFPMTFVSSGFVSPETMPDWLQRAAELNPFSVAITAVFSLLAFRKFSSTSR